MQVLLAALPIWFFSASADDRGPKPRGLSVRPGHASVEIFPHDVLIARLRANDAAALADAHTAYAAELWQHAHRYVHDRDAAEDIVQDVFVAVWERRAELPTTVTLRSYLYAAVRNRSLNQVRHWNIVARTQRDAATYEHTAMTPAALLADTDAEHATLTALVGRALSELPERQRAAIELHCLQRLTQTETALILHISEASVRRLLDRAVRRLESLQRRLRES